MKEETAVGFFLGVLFFPWRTSVGSNLFSFREKLLLWILVWASLLNLVWAILALCLGEGRFG